jgi:arylsulfatase A-like enzyme
MIFMISMISMLSMTLVTSLHVGSWTPVMSSPNPPDRPDIILIVADDLGWGDVSFLDATDLQTPSIDALAGSGAVLTDFHAGASVCTPSRFAMFTGQHPWRSRGGLGGVLMIFDQSHRTRGFQDGEQTFAESLEELGYDTMLAGKWHLGHGDSKVSPLANGFDGFVGCRGGCIDYFTHAYATVPDWWRGDEAVIEEGEATDLIADAAAGFIEDHGVKGGDEDPFLLVVSFTAPHYGKSCLDQVASDPGTLVTRKAGGLRNDVDGVPRQPVNTLQSTVADLEAVGGPIIVDQGPDAKAVVSESATIDHAIRRRHYAAMMKALDDGVERVLSALERSGRENVVVIFTADNGPDETISNAGSSGRWKGGKHGLAEGGTRVPSILRWPGVVPAGSTIDQLGGLIDLHPTFLRLAGKTDELPRFDGIDLLPAWRGGEEIERHLAFRQGGRRSVRRGDWKWHDGRLYDLAQDPGEATDLASSEPELAAELARLSKLADRPISSP